jgi:hypothetical protein
MEWKCILEKQIQCQFLMEMMSIFLMPCASSCILYLVNWIQSIWYALLDRNPNKYWIEFRWIWVQFNSNRIACNVINIFIHISTTSFFSHRFIVTDNAQHAKPKSSIFGYSPINRKCAHLIRKKNCPRQILNHLSLLKYHPFASNFIC